MTFRCDHPNQWDTFPTSRTIVSQFFIKPIATGNHLMKPGWKSSLIKVFSWKGERMHAASDYSDFQSTPEQKCNGSVGSGRGVVKIHTHPKVKPHCHRTAPLRPDAQVQLRHSWPCPAFSLGALLHSYLAWPWSIKHNKVCGKAELREHN